MRSVLRVLTLAILLGFGFAPMDAAAQYYRDGGYERPRYGQQPVARSGYGRPQGQYGRDEKATRPRYPGRPDRRPGRPGGDWRPGAIGIGAGIIGGIILDQARRPPPTYYDVEDEPPPPRRPRRPVYVDDDLYREPPAAERPRRPPPPRTPPRTAQPAQPPRAVIPASTENRFVADEVLFELAPNASLQAVLRRHRATAISTQRFELAGVTVVRARLDGGRNARTALRQMSGDARIVRAQPNYTYTLQQAQAAVTIEPPAAPAATPAETQAAPPPSASPPPPARQPQYAIERIGLPAALERATGKDVPVAVIDSAIDLTHPELAGVRTERFDAIGGEAPPHSHGTAMAATIHGQAQLQGVAPGARLLAARAFSAGAPGRAGGSTFHVMLALDWAASQGARVLNLSFAGPQDRLLSQALAGAAKRRIVALAAAGNAGPKSAPLYPGADPNTIAVTATDADDKPFEGANRGAYVAVAAPGVDVIAAEPGGRYAFSTGTSIATAHAAGLVALLLEKRPDLDLDGVRKLLAESAQDLGARGRDPVFGAGRIDAPAALARALPVSALR